MIDKPAHPPPQTERKSLVIVKTVVWTAYSIVVAHIGAALTDLLRQKICDRLREAVNFE